MCGLCILPDAASSQDDQRRWFLPPALTATFTDRTGDLYGDPWYLVADPRGGFLVSEATTVHAFWADGEHRWSAGREGEGPGEFLGIQDLDVTPDGQVLVVDQLQPRLTVFDASSGALTATVPLPRGALVREQYEVDALLGLQVLPALGTTARVAMDIPEGPQPWWTLSKQGDPVEGIKLPVSCTYRLTCEMRAVGDGNWGAVVAFRWSSTVAMLNPDGSVRAMFEGVDAITFPEVVSYEMDPEGFDIEGIKALRVTRVDPKAPEATRSIATDESRLMVLAMTGGTEYRRRIIDVYALENGEYQGSYLLPEPVRNIALLADGRLATLTSVLFPEVQIWELPR